LITARKFRHFSKQAFEKSIRIFLYFT
jgi:hypothetical protein